MTTQGDIQRIAQAAVHALPRLVEEWLPAGKWRGAEYVVGDIAGSEGDSLSINTQSGQWCDFADDAYKGGDPVSLLAAIRGYTGEHPQLEAAKELADQLGIDPPGASGSSNAEAIPPEPKAKTGGPGKNDKPDPIHPVPRGAGDPPDTFHRKTKAGEWESIQVTKRWEYRDTEGTLLGYVCRFDLGDGEKEVIPQCWANHPKHGERWCWVSFARPRPLYGLDRLAANPGAHVLLVEGEKAADAGQRLLSGRGVVVLSWPGGGKAINMVDWTPLRGRKVALWPDADTPGRKTMDGHQDERGRNHKGVADLVGKVAQDLRVVDPPANVGEGWDAADAEGEGWTADDVLGHVRQNLRAPSPVKPEQPDQPEPPDDAEPPMPEPPPEAFSDEPHEPVGTACGMDGDADPFVCLGYDHSAYYYLPRRTQQVVRLPTAAHTKVQLLELAPLWWWEQQFPGKNGPDWLRAADTLITINSRRVYDPSRIRGAGAWYDEGRSVLHLGDQLLVDNQRMGMTDISSRYIYEAGPSLETDPVEHLPTREANRLVEICESLEWEHPMYARLLAGWCVIAPICGAMNWRPHVWITGRSGTGKSWVANHVVEPCLGPTALPVQGSTTEAGMRQALRQDARPIVFDEAEAENRQGQQRIQSILDLARQASTEHNGAILKGSTGGQSMVFRVRSCFCLVSIGVGLQQQADQNRWTKLVMRPNRRPTARQEFDRIERMVHETLTPAYTAALRARAYRLIPVIRDNARTFARAGVEALGSQRAGDQVGALLAGAYALFSGKRISPEEAQEWIESQDWGGQGESASLTDEERCLAEIAQNVVRVEGERSSFNLAVGELIHTALRGQSMDIDATQAQQSLSRHGVKTERRDGVERVVISSSHRELRRLLQDSPWAVNWPDIVGRVQGAQTKPSVRFGGVTTRATSIPANAMLGEPEPEEGETQDWTQTTEASAPTPWDAPAG